MPVMAGGEMLAVCANIKNVYITSNKKSQEKRVYKKNIHPNLFRNIVI